MKDIIIEVATPDDIKDLENLTRLLVEGLGQEFIPKRFDWGIRRRLFDPLQRHGILIAKDSESQDAVGMIIAELRIDPYGASEGYIKQVFLKKPYRGHGLGKKLVQSAIDHLKKINVEKIKVNVKEKATKAMDLYGKMNFKKVYEVLELELTENGSEREEQVEKKQKI
ncbi:MAG: GNAT family N-acetyltransferase [Promethearchaeia archaeon]